MKVLMIWQFYPPDEVGLALSARGVAICKYLRRLGCEVTVFAPDFNGKSKVYELGGVNVRRIETYDSVRSGSGLLWSLSRIADMQTELMVRAKEVDPDIVIVSQPSYTLPAQALITAKMLSIPCVLDMQDIFAQEVEFFPNELTNSLKIQLEAFVLKNVDSVVTVLPLMREMAIEKYEVDKSKFHILYNGFDSESIPELGSIPREKDIDFLHVGAPRAYYDSLSLVEALGIMVKSRPQTKLVFVGCDQNPHEQQVRERVENLDLEKNVIFEGLLLSRKGIFELMQRSKMGVYTLYPGHSSRVLVGIKVFEYLAAGLPIAHLGTRRGSMDTIIRRHAAGTSEEKPKDFAKRALSVLDNDSLLGQYSRNALQAL
ncbi:MAG: glycosyltransferase family 4 protein, partial [Thermoplasmata archaeon]|nr:glycosyltransferase family 4 protein [Thermoplasmata archaeon]